jgi:hypothetical protein
LGNVGAEEAVTLDSHDEAAAALSSQSSEIAANPIRAIIPTTTIGQEKTRGRAACFSTSKF